MRTANTEFKASDLSSRKLWEIISGLDESQPAQTDLEEAIQELSVRRHYLNELRQIGIYTLPHS